MQTATQSPSRSRFSLRRRAEDRALTQASLPAVMLDGGAGGYGVTTREALGVADVYAAVRALVDSISTLPLGVYRRTNQGRVQIDRGRPTDLLRYPAPAVPQYAFLGQVVGSLVTRGDAFVGLYRDGEGEVSQLGVIEPSAVVVEVKGGIPFYGVTLPDGRQASFTTADVLHIRAPLTLDGVRGLSPLAAARQAISSARSLSTFTSRTFENDARPSGILRVPSGPAADDQMQALDDAWASRHQGPERAGRIAVLSGEVTFEALSIPARDLEFVEQRKLSTAEVARIFRLPPWILGAPSGDSLTYSNTSEQMRAFAAFALRPWLVAIERALTGCGELFPPDTYCEFELDGLLRADPKTRAEVYTAALAPDTGWMTRAEVRQLENLPPEGQEVTDA